MRVKSIYILAFLLLYPFLGGILSNFYCYFYLPENKVRIEADVFYDLKNNRGGPRGLTFIFKDFTNKDGNTNLPIGFDDKYYNYFKDKKKYNLNIIYKTNSYKFLTFSRDYFFIAAYGDDGYFLYKPSISFFLVKNLSNIMISFFIILFLYKRNDFI